MNEEENTLYNGDVKEIVDCLHEEDAVYALAAGKNRVFMLCRICYAQIYQDIVNEVLASMAQGMINNAL